MNDSLLPLGILLLGIAGIAGFIAFRPWPASPESKPISAGAYVVEILQGQPPAASISPKESGQQASTIAEIENGLAALLVIWFVSKLASGLTGILGAFGVGELWQTTTGICRNAGSSSARSANSGSSGHRQIVNHDLAAAAGRRAGQRAPSPPDPEPTRGRAPWRRCCWSGSSSSLSA